MAEEGFSNRNSSGNDGSQRRRSSSRPSARGYRVAEGQTRSSRSASRSSYDQPKVQTPAAERLSQYTRNSPADRRRIERSSREASNRGTSRANRQQGRVTYEDAPRQRRTVQASSYDTRQGGGVLDSVLTVVFGVIGAIGSAGLAVVHALQGVVPALQRFSPRVLASVLGVLVVAVVGVGVFAANGFGQGGGTEQPEASSEASAESEEAAATVGSGVNPDEPADLVWRDEDFAVDPAKNTWSNKDNGHKTVFLTIDDGPSTLTEPVLDLLDQYNVKATFFVIGANPEHYALIREAYNRGHTIGLHSMSHDYSQVYASEEAYFRDLDAIGQVVKEQIGYVPCFVRFPGGSSNTQAVAQSGDPKLMQRLTQGLLARGYQYYDWSLSSGDGEVRSTQELIAQSTEPSGTESDPTKDTNIVLLCHDSATKQTTLEALPQIIEHYQNKGYTFEAIDRSSWICHHAIYVDPAAEATQNTADGTGTADMADPATGQEMGADAYADGGATGDGAYAEEPYYGEEAA